MQKSQSLKNFSEETSLHGLKNTVDKQNRTQVYQIFWILLLLTCCVACISLLTVTIYNYFKYESVTSYTLTYTHTLDFPAVTICNRKVLKRSYLTLPILTQFYSFQADPNSTYFTNKTFQDSFHQELNKIKIQDIFDEFGFTSLETIVYCTIQSSQNCTSSWRSTHTEASLCHTFNSKEWMEQNERFTVSEAGPISGLHLVLDLTEDSGLSLGDGFLFLIHDPSVYPSIARGGFLVAPGKETYISLKLTEVERLSIPYSEQECVDTSDGSNKGYSKEECWLHCYLHEVYQHKCNFFGDGENRCSLLHILRNPKNVSYSDVYDQCDHCKATCKSKQYSHSLSTTDFKTEHLEPLATHYKWPVTNISYLQNNYAVVNIFFESMEYTKTTQQAAVSYQSVISDIGGLLGFTLGASVITLFELSEFCIKSLLYLFKKRRSKKKTVMGQNVK